eukprot:13112206-Heterocapsa_arctica.AAC.1
MASSPWMRSRSLAARRTKASRSTATCRCSWRSAGFHAPETPTHQACETTWRTSVRHEATMSFSKRCFIAFELASSSGRRSSPTSSAAP